VKLFCGIDWAEGHHDVAIIDGDGQLVSKKRISDDPAGFAELIELLTGAGDRNPTWPAGRLPEGHWTAGVCDQPVGGGPIPGTPLGGEVEVRSR
jgi:Transposase